MQPDLVWIKERSVSGNHQLQDSVRGTSKKLMTNSTDAEGTESAYITSFDSDGFSIGANNGINQSGVTNVAWCWKESATAGFDMVGYTGTGSNMTISHSLSAVPHMVIIKCRTTAATDWQVYHHKNTSAPETDFLTLTNTNATTDSNTRWNDTAPTSSVVSLGTSGDLNHDNTRTYIAYIFSEKQGFSKFGSYTGNGNADGTFVYTGFRPAWVMFKNASAGSSNWQIYDNKRNGYNGSNELFRANATDVGEVVDPIDILSNGFKQYNTAASNNVSGQTYVYMAFAEAPFVNSNGVPCNAR